MSVLVYAYTVGICKCMCMLHSHLHMHLNVHVRVYGGPGLRASHTDSLHEFAVPAIVHRHVDCQKKTLPRGSPPSATHPIFVFDILGGGRGLLLVWVLAQGGS